MAMSDYDDTGLAVTVTVTGGGIFFDSIDSTLLDDPSPDLLEQVAKALPSATFTDPD